MSRSLTTARSRVAPCLVLAILSSGCFGLGPRSSAPARSTGTFPAPMEATAVLYADDLAPIATPGGNLTDLIRRTVAGMRVDRSSHAGTCPKLLFRGHRSLVLSSEPVIYIDGVRQWDTCSLDLIPPLDVASVEIYAGGQGGGMLTNPGGTILVFTKR